MAQPGRLLDARWNVLGDKDSRRERRQAALRGLLHRPSGGPDETSATVTLLAPSSGGEARGPTVFADHGDRRDRTASGLPAEALIDAAARRQKWIDQSQSLNLFLAAPDMKTMSHMYRRAWRAGLKTTYYLRNGEECEACQ